MFRAFTACVLNFILLVIAMGVVCPLYAQSNLESLVDILPRIQSGKSVKTIALFDHQDLADLLKSDSVLSPYLSPLRLNPGSVHQDLKAMLGTHVRIDESAYSEQMIDMQKKGMSGLSIDAMRILSDRHTLDGIVTYSLQKDREKEKNRYLLNVYTYSRLSDNLNHRTIALTDTRGSLQTLNWRFLLLPACLIALMLFLLFVRKTIHRTSVVLRIRYDHIIKNIHFVVRLSKRNLSDQRRFDHLWLKFYETQDKDRINRYLDFFNIPITLATNDIARLSHVSKGKYKLFVTAVIYCPKTNIIIGRHEITRQVNVEAYLDTKMDLDFELEEAFVEVRPHLPLANLSTLTDLEKDKTDDQILVAIDNDPSLTRIGRPKESFAYCLPKGSYRIRATQGLNIGLEEITIANSEPRTIVILMHSEKDTETLEKRKQQAATDYGYDAENKPPAITAAEPTSKMEVFHGSTFPIKEKESEPRRLFQPKDPVTAVIEADGNEAMEAAIESFERMEISYGAKHPEAQEEHTTAPAPEKGKFSISGQLDEIPLSDMVQMLCNSDKTGILYLNREGDDAKVFIAKGQVINCSFMDKEGKEAFYKLLAWDDGEFSFHTITPDVAQKIDLPVPNLLLEGFRLLDEQRAGKI